MKDKTRTRTCLVLEHTTLVHPSLFQFEVQVGQCHRRKSLTFCFALFQLGVRIWVIIHRYTLLKIFTSICLIGHVRPFCTLATRLVRERETIIVTLIVASQVLYKTRTEISRQFLDEPSGSSKSKACQRVRYMFMIFIIIALYLSVPNLKDHFSIWHLEERRYDGHLKGIRRYIPCCIPSSLWGQANYLFRNRYNFWCCSSTLCGNPRRKSTDVLWSTLAPTAHHCPSLLVLPGFCLSSISSY